ncbi:MAG: hypothetical protein H3Z52_09555 [archaeon]|nr:hypothetical protein [archaeon]MCP8321168.1 hypothetical protein [archaeon]
MITEKKITALLIIFTVLTLVSITSVYYTYQQPLYQTTTLGTCQHEGIYDYIAQLKPNIIYNKTTLTPDEGTLYTNIVNYINITFTYTFTSTPKPTNQTVQHQISVQLESPGKWARDFTTIETQEILQLTNDLNFTLQINPTKIAEIVGQIDNETGISSANYRINIRPTIHIIANVTASIIEDTFNPQLTIAFVQDSASGRYIAIWPLKTRIEKTTGTEQILQPWVANLRIASIMFAIASASGLTIATGLYIKTRPKEKSMAKIMAPYKEIIAETTQKPPETNITINVKTLEDLAKIADTLTKPVLYLKEEKDHNFYVIDDQITYQYKTKNMNY